MSLLSEASVSVNKFSMSLYSKLVRNKPSENLFYSPASICVALAMTYAGCNGNTAKEIEQAMNWNKPKIVHEMMQTLQESILSTSGSRIGIELSLANRLWAQDGYAILKEYTNIMQSFYKAEIGIADFVSQPKKARETMNLWVEEKTNDKIKDLIKDGVLTANTRLVLINAVYFKGLWEDQFKKSDTHPSYFKTSKTTSIIIKMMNKIDKYSHGRNEELACQILKLPYKEKKMSMTIFLPHEVDGIHKLESKINAEHLQKYNKLLSKKKLMVSLPQFKLNCQFNMNEVLSQLTIRELFDVKKADLSGVTGNRELYVSNVIHQAFVNVNEEGTEAAAATAVAMTGAGCPPPLPHFLADHPFLFVIQHCESGAILFAGRFVNPDS